MREMQLDIAEVFLDPDRPDVVLAIYATGIMHIEKHDGGHRWALVWSDPDTLAYHNDELWDGIPLLPSNRRRTRNPTVPTIPA